MRTYWIDVRWEVIKINEQVNAVVRKRLHAAIVVGGWIDVVNTDGVCTKLLHESGIELALLGVHQRIIRDELVSNAYEIMLAAAQLRKRNGRHPYP